MKSPLLPWENDRERSLSTEVSPAASDPTFYMPKAEVSRFVSMLLRRGWIVIVAGLLAAVAAWWVLGQMPKVYRATGSVYISTETPQVFDVRPVASEEARDLEQMLSVERGMSSSSVLLRVIDREGLMDDPDFAAADTTRQGVLGVLADRVDVGLSRGTRVIEISVEDTDPERAARLVEAIKLEYETWSEEGREKVLEQASAGLAREEERLRLRMEASEAALQGFREKHPVPGLSVTGGSRQETLDILNSRLTQAKAERLKLEAEREAFARFDPADPDGLAGLTEGEHSAEVLSLVRELRNREVEFAKVKERYLFKHPTFKEASRAVEGARENLTRAVLTAGEAIEKGYQVAKQNESKLEAEVGLASGEAVGVEGLRAEFAKLTREATANRELHASVARRLRETAMVGSVSSSFLSWQDQPLAPEHPHRPHRMILTPLAGMGGAFLGCLLMLGLEFGDRRVRDAAAVTRATGVPLLARLPDGAAGDGMVVLSSPQSTTAEAFRRLRAVLIPRSNGEGMRTVLFASAREGEGTSFCSVNHAVSLAVQGYRTLLIDADLRKPGLSRDHLKEPGGDLGLGAYLAGETSPAEACVRTPVERLFLMSSGEMRSNAAELLSGTRFPALLEEAQRWFDRVVIDVPSVLSNSDAQVVARYADHTCLVVGEGGGDRRELKQSAEILRAGGANIVGFVWNEHPAHANGGPSLPVARPKLTEPSTTPLVETLTPESID